MAGSPDLGSQLKALYDNFTAGQKLSIIILIIFLAGLFGALAFWAGRPEYQILYAKLTPEDAQTVVSSIEGKTKYELRDNGSTILVPKESVYKLRLELASKGLPKGGAVGFEIFDKTSFGATDFTQRVNYKRAIEGELARTIMQLDAVESAKVMIAIPEKRLFEEEQNQPTASIVLGLRNQGALTPAQVQGIVYLVSSSVEELQPSSITVIDTKGNVLYKGTADSQAELANNQYEFKKNYEANLEDKVKSMVEKIVGDGKAVVMVSAEFDFNAVAKTEEIYDPEKAVIVSEQRSSETSDNQTATPSGTPGVRSNVPPTTEGGGEKSATSAAKKTSETINYEVTKVVKNTKEAIGELMRLSISLIVDGVYKEVIEAATGGNEEKKKLEYSPRSEEEMNKIKALVMRAIGFNEERGDKVEVENMQFQKAEVLEKAEEGAAPKEETAPTIQDIAKKYALPIVITLAVFLFVIRPMLKWMTQMPKIAVSEEGFAGGGEEGGIIRREGGRAKGGGKTAEEVETDMEEEIKELEAEIAGETKMPEGAKRKQAIKHRISRLAEKDPEAVAQLVKTWLHED